MEQFNSNEISMLAEAGAKAVEGKQYTGEELKMFGNIVMDYIMSKSKNERCDFLNKFRSITEKTVI